MVVECDEQLHEHVDFGAAVVLDDAGEILGCLEQLRPRIRFLADVV